MDEITFQVEVDGESDVLVASWNDPAGGGITTQGRDLRDLQEQIADAVTVHFDEGEVPKKVRLHFLNDPVLVTA